MITAAILLCLSPVAIDGDTVRCGTSPATIRLFGVQAPERGRAGASASTINLSGKIAGGLICDPRGANYSRIVAVCRNAAGDDVGRAQLAAGHAVEWCAYSRNYYATCPTP